MLRMVPGCGAEATEVRRDRTPDPEVKPPGNPWEKHGKTMGKPGENQRNLTCQFHRKIMEKWENQGKSRKSGENQLHRRPANLGLSFLLKTVREF